MADKTMKVEGNVDGKWYIDENCIACEACLEFAEGYIEMDEEIGFCKVVKQPTDSEGEEAMVEAQESCPVEAIGDDG